jgi:hypothetical protein
MQMQAPPRSSPLVKHNSVHHGDSSSGSAFEVDDAAESDGSDDSVSSRERRGRLGKRPPGLQFFLVFGCMVELKADERATPVISIDQSSGSEPDD